LDDSGAKPAPKAAPSASETQKSPAPKSKNENPAPTSKPQTPADAHSAQPEPRVMPAAQRLLQEHGVETKDVKATGPGGRVLKEDVQRHVEQQTPGPAGRPEAGKPVSPAPTSSTAWREEQVVPMSMLRRTVAKRLVEAQQNAALLTTFNEVDMSSVIALRKEFGEGFQEKYNAKLGFMSFFVKTAIEALKEYPQLNAEIRGNDIAYRNYFDIGIAIGSGKGLVVPVLQNAERLSFAEVEKAIADFAARAKSHQLKPEELTGGTFTITNGGVYGSLLSTPIVNPPQSGVLGLHAIQERPVAVEGNVVIRPMMYLALTYDHRIVDGREAVSFLRRVKDLIEKPARILLEI
jgi:2-oxoglutarate dehydrogenase E2 component (dihydrolipoamide succinyltransferase)